MAPDMRGHLINRKETDVDCLWSKSLHFANFTKTCSCRYIGRDPKGLMQVGPLKLKTELASRYLAGGETKKR